MTAVSVRDLRKDYGSVRALRGLSLEVGAGEIYGLLGPNGAGKTTALEILEGYRAPTAGTVTVLGGVPGHRSIRARTGILLQQSAADPYLTVAETLRMVAGWYPDPRPIDEMLAAAGLSDLAGSRVKRLSGGQRRRLDLAVALVGRPDLLFLDEPTTGFDPVARREAWAALRVGVDDGMTVLLSTHDLEEARALCDRIGVVAGGRLVAEGTPAELAARHGVRIEVSLPEPPPPAAGLDDLGGGRYGAELEDPAAALVALSSWARDRGLPLDSLRVAPASLEDVYLALVREVEG